ncbi:hypothetical protein BABINDRAFT_162089 [Babjeviella inositovora NRRL Y-12698]|uniref:protein-serine/threonine phosphatase n=1 Tax=Babjeviella inositovora NRRL Y-12698 TaxID=984486 RepID=A0A1E3QN05_9ASCO|nr:uncharacterized protein BABINDRAFT_162089 [Babjeviella inositovora NRRL Y-12698]ODQ79018.1 hypothetical protein BABINDRAFT_162089 [Babjeviella inositovora NRRL Y-12698]
MGQILSQPVTEKTSEEGADKYLAYGLSCMQGWRVSMEDAHSTVLNLNAEDASKDHVAFFGVYDGHGGEKVALFTGDHLHEVIRQTEAFQNQNYIQALRDGFMGMDRAILDDTVMKHDESGCAATSAIITKDKIICGNAGDSRTIMSINGQAKALSYDHKPTNQGESMRIYNAGSYVDGGRVNGNLALSRAIGDFEFKRKTNIPPELQAVTANPDVIEHTLSAEDEFIVLACDGIWDCLSSQQVVEVVRRGIQDDKTLIEICEILMEICLAPNTGGAGIGCDNMSVCVVALLQGTQTLEEWHVAMKAKIAKDGIVSAPYADLSRDLYGSEHSFGSEDATPRAPAGPVAGAPLGFSLEELLARDAVRIENGAVYFDQSAAADLMANFGIGGPLSAFINNDDEESEAEAQIKEIEEDESKKEETDDDEVAK